MLSLGSSAQTPQELFEHILWHVVRDQYVHEVPKALAQDVHCLTSLALVSTYFAGLCRPWLYHNIRLRSRKHFEGLLAILDSDSNHSIIPSLLTYTKHIGMSPTQSDDHWVLHLSMVLIPRMRALGIHNIPLVRLSLETLIPGLGNNRSTLPRDLPPSLFRCIYALDLSETHFKDGGELLRCLSMLPSATTVNFVSVLCSAPLDYPPWMGRSLSPRLKTVTANQTEPPDNVFATILPAMLAGFQENLARLELLDLAQLMRSADVKAQEIDDHGWWTISRNSRCKYTISPHETAAQTDITC